YLRWHIVAELQGFIITNDQEMILGARNCSVFRSYYPHVRRGWRASSSATLPRLLPAGGCDLRDRLDRPHRRLAAKAATAFCRGLGRATSSGAAGQPGVFARRPLAD